MYPPPLGCFHKTSFSMYCVTLGLGGGRGKIYRSRTSGHICIWVVEYCASENVTSEKCVKKHHLN